METLLEQKEESFFKCDDCEGEGEISTGEFDDVITRKCHCQFDNDDEYDNLKQSC